MNETRTERPTISQLVFDCVTKHAPISAKGIEQELKRMGIKVASVPALISPLRKQGKIEECGREQSERKDNTTRALYRVAQAPSKAEEKKESKPAELAEMHRDSFVFYRDWAEALRPLPAEVKAKCYDAITDYAFGGIPPQDPTISAITGVIRGQINRDSIKYAKTVKQRREAGRKGMAARWGSTANNKCYERYNKNNKQYQTITKITDNVYDNVYDNDHVCIDTRQDAHTQRDISFANFTEWIMTACPHVAALEEQMTEPQFTDYIDEFGREKLFQIVKEMENNISIGKNRSVYQTARNWTKRKK